MEKNTDLRLLAEEIRLETLLEFQHLGFGHVGGSMSVIELLAVLYGGEMRIFENNPTTSDRDRLIMSKGHAGPALYAALAIKGYFPKETLKTLNQGGTKLPSHCDGNLTPGVDATTGSLGQGISVACGIALGNKIQKRELYTYLVLGDGECNEGQVWEGAMFAAHNKLNNLITFVDLNKQQLDGLNDDVMYMGDMVDKWESFGWLAIKVNGHNVDDIKEAIKKGKSQRGRPVAIILDTVKGNGCLLAEETFPCHHIAFSKEAIEPSIELVRQNLARLKG